MKSIDYNALLVDLSDTPGYVSDAETYELLYMNASAMKLYGVDESEYRKKKCYQVLFGKEEPCSFCTNCSFVDGQRSRWEQYNDKIKKWLDISDMMIRIDGRLLRAGATRDITVRREDQPIWSDQLNMEDILFRCLNVLIKEKDISRAIRILLKTLCIYYQADRAYIFEFDYGQQTLNNTFEWCAPGITAEIDRLQDIPLEVVSNWIEMFNSYGEFTISALDHDVDPSSKAYQLLEMQEIDSLMAAPLLNDENRITGFLGIDNPRKDRGNTILLRSVSKFVLTELEKRRWSQELEYLSYTDTLTGLQNRNRYNQVLQQYQSMAPEILGTIYVSVNGLKGVNEKYGIRYGDMTLKRTAEIMQSIIPCTCFRIGGDEFMALCEGVAKDLFQKRVSELRRTFETERVCDVSIGCVWRTGEINVLEQIQQTTEMMYAEKQTYYSSMLKGDHSGLHVSLAAEIMQEIEDGRFVVYYQPQVDLRCGAIVGAEALVRKIGEDGKIIPPGNFIPFYESTGVIRYVDLFVMETACRTVHEWGEQGHPLLISVNFSRMTLMEPGIVKTIKNICKKCQVPTSAVTIEVTENISKMEREYLQRLIWELKGEGFSVSLDDFGSSYSNLAMLSSMHFDEIKFDRSLVMGMENNRKSRAVLKHSIQMCRELGGSRTLAEGIETFSEFSLLKEFSCDYGQGYYFSRPVPTEDFSALLRGEKGFSMK